MVNPAIAVPIATSILGGLGGKRSAKSMSQPTSSNNRFSNYSQLSPFGGAAGNEFLNNFLFNLAPDTFNSSMGMLPTGPNPFSMMGVTGLAQQMMGGGFDMPGIHVPQLGPAPGVGLSDDVWARLQKSGPSANINSLGVKTVGMSPEEIARFETEVRPELADVMGGKFIGDNPYIDQVIDASNTDAAELYAQTIAPMINSGFAQGGRLGSFGQAAAQAMANEEFMQDQMAMGSQMRMQDLQSERARQMQGFGIDAQLQNAARAVLSSMRNTDMSSAASLRGTAIGAAAQRAIAEASIRSQLEQAGAALQAQYDLGQAGFDMQGQALGLESAYKEAMMNMQGYGNLFGMGNDLYGQQRQRAIDPMSMLGQFGGMILPGLAQFGKQSNYGTSSGTNQGPQYSQGQGFLQGALGGGLQGMGLSNMMGGKGGGGFGANPGAQFPNFSPYPWYNQFAPIWQGTPYK
jgi:hypothetical protein